MMGEAAKAKFRFIELEIGGSETVIQEGLRSIVQMFQAQPHSEPPASVSLCRTGRPIEDAAPEQERLAEPTVRKNRTVETPPEPLSKRIAKAARKPKHGVEKEKRICMNPACGKSFVPKITVGPRSQTVCGKKDCIKYRNAKRLRDNRAAKASPPRGGSSFRAHNPEPASAPLPPDSEHGAGFSMSEIRGLTPEAALRLWAKRHHNLIDVPRAVPIFRAAEVLSGNEAAVRNKMLDRLEGMQDFSTTEAALVYELEG